MMAPKTGDEVGAKRWPYSSGHVGTWGLPWSGTVLDIQDPRAWTGLCGRAVPDAKTVARHVAWATQNGLMLDSVPVLWHFDTGPKVFWERTASLRTYGEDMAEWNQAKLLRAAMLT